MYKQRDIVLIPFPYTDLTAAKLRPALIISNGKFNKTQDRICCLITSNSPSDGILITQTVEGKLPFKSWVKPHRIFTVDERIIRKKLCSASIRTHKETVQRINEIISG
jgi:mRNA interferase MazF